MRKLIVTLTAAVSVAVWLAAATPVAAQAPAAVTGEWNAMMNTPGGPRDFKVIFAQKGDSLSGTVKRASGDVPLKGAVKGAVVTFEYTIDYGGNPITLVVTATVNGAAMKGTIDLSGGVVEEFSAARAAP